MRKSVGFDTGTGVIELHPLDVIEAAWTSAGRAGGFIVYCRLKKGHAFESVQLMLPRTVAEKLVKDLQRQLCPSPEEVKKRERYAALLGKLGSVYHTRSQEA